MDRPIHYARNGDVHIAYQVVGDGPIDLVYAPGIWSNLEVMWEWPAWAGFLERLAAFSRLIIFDMRGVGLSDRGREPPILELQADDLRAVLDAAGCDRPAILGGARGGGMTALFAAQYPERVRALVLYAPVVKTVQAPGWPYGRTPQEQAAVVDTWQRELGSGAILRLQGPIPNAAFARWWARFERLTATPSAYNELIGILTDIDARAMLPHIQAPTLVLHRRDDPIVDFPQGRAAANLIPGARLVELKGDHHFPFLGETDAIVSEIERFLTGSHTAAAFDRILSTILFTDLVGSTHRAAAMGDRAWRDLLLQHRDIVRAKLSAFRGREIDTAGDGFMASFDGAARAVRCAEEVAREVSELGIEIRAGVHSGECEVVERGLAGIAVHIAARVASFAGPGEVVVSSTVRDLVVGSDLVFDEIGEHELKGVPGAWRLYRLA